MLHVCNLGIGLLHLRFCCSLLHYFALGFVAVAHLLQLLRGRQLLLLLIHLLAHFQNVFGLLEQCIVHLFALL